MTNKEMNHELDQLAAMFCQLGKAAAQMGGGNHAGEERTRHGNGKPGVDQPEVSMCPVADDVVVI